MDIKHVLNRTTNDSPRKEDVWKLDDLTMTMKAKFNAQLSKIDGFFVIWILAYHFTPSKW